MVSSSNGNSELVVQALGHIAILATAIASLVATFRLGRKQKEIHQEVQKVKEVLNGTIKEA